MIVDFGHLVVEWESLEVCVVFHIALDLGQKRDA